MCTYKPSAANSLRPARFAPGSSWGPAAVCRLARTRQHSSGVLASLFSRTQSRGTPPALFAPPLLEQSLLFGPRCPRTSGQDCLEQVSQTHRTDCVALQFRVAASSGCFLESIEDVDSPCHSR